MHNCRPSEGGTPLCGLGQTAKFVEIRGKWWDSYQTINRLSRTANVMVIAENPGSLESSIGEAYIGDSAKKLKTFIRRSGLEQVQHIYLTYLTKCRPHKRSPSTAESKACRVHLDAEIRKYLPKVVLLLGKGALRAFGIQGSVMNIRGQIIKKKFPGWDDGPEFIVIPTLEPYYFVKTQNMGLERRVLDDYRLVIAALNGKETVEPYVPEFKVIDSNEVLDECIEKIKAKKVFGFDTESPWARFKRDPMLAVGFSVGRGENYVLPYHQHEPDETNRYKLPDYQSKPFPYTYNNWEHVTSRIKEVFEDPEIVKAAHSFKYDQNVLRAYLGIHIQGMKFCTMVMHHTLDENPPHDLETLADIEFGFGDYKRPVRDIVGHGREIVKGFDHVPDHILWPYLATDCEATYLLWEAYWPRLEEKENLKNLYLEESMPGIDALAQAEYDGCKLDLNVTETLRVEYEDRQNILLAGMRRVTWPDFKPMSSKQVINAFIGLDMEELIRKPESASGYSADRNRLNEIKDKVPLAYQLLEYRTNRKILSTYLANAKNNLDSDGRIRYNFNQHGTKTGRLSCRFLHQIPKIAKERVKAGKYNLRDMIVAEDGFSLVYGDFSQVELRILAAQTQDPELLRVFKDGLDLHAITTSEFLGMPESEVSDYNRTEVGKRINFALAYGSEGHSIVKSGKWKDAEGIERNFTYDMLDEGMKRWKARFVGVGHFLDNLADEARANGCIVYSAFWRERRLPELNMDDKWLVAAARREGVNFPIQAGAGGLTNRTINMIWTEVICKLKLWDRVRLINTVHDSVLYEVEDKLVPWFREVLKKIATRPIPEYHGASFPMDTGVGHSWAAAELNSKVKA
jgi:DNA polymerase-1